MTHTCNRPNDLDRQLTGNWGEDSVPEEKTMRYTVRWVEYNAVAKCLDARSLVCETYEQALTLKDILEANEQDEVTIDEANACAVCGRAVTHQDGSMSLKSYCSGDCASTVR